MRGMENVWKALIAACLAALGAYLRQLATPLAVLIAVMVLDYISGMIAAVRTHTLDSRIGIAPSHIHGFLHVSPHFFLGDVVVTGNLADDPCRPLQFSLRVHSSVSFVSVSTNGKRYTLWG